MSLQYVSTFSIIWDFQKCCPVLALTSAHTLVSAHPRLRWQGRAASPPAPAGPPATASTWLPAASMSVPPSETWSDNWETSNRDWRMREPWRSTESCRRLSGWKANLCQRNEVSAISQLSFLPYSVLWELETVISLVPLCQYLIYPIYFPVQISQDKVTNERLCIRGL